MVSSISVVWFLYHTTVILIGEHCQDPHFLCWDRYTSLYLTPWVTQGLLAVSLPHQYFWALARWSMPSSALLLYEVLYFIQWYAKVEVVAANQFCKVYCYKTTFLVYYWTAA